MDTTMTRRSTDTSPTAVESSKSAVLWAPIIAGAVIATAISLILLALGSGFGFAAASPWPGAGPAAETFAITAGIWLIVTQWLASAMGGYVTGRLRTKWVGVHTHEVMFRDTAHGLLAWALSTVIVAGIAFGVMSSAASTATSAATSSVSYVTDTMMRSTRNDAGASAMARAELGRILSQGATLRPDDRNYLIDQIAAQTGVSRDEAGRRVDVAMTSIREAADKARKVSSAVGFFTALSLLIGAFIASVAAAYAGRLRDDNEEIKVSV